MGQEDLCCAYKSDHNRVDIGDRNNMEDDSEIKPMETSSDRSDFLKKYKEKGPRPRRNIFEDYTQVNSYELDLPNTQNKLVISLHQKKTDEKDYLLKWQIGKSSMFIDAKTTFIVSEAMRFLTEDIVPDDLKPTVDIKPKEIPQ